MVISCYQLVKLKVLKSSSKIRVSALTIEATEAMAILENINNY